MNDNSIHLFVVLLFTLVLFACNGKQEPSEPRGRTINPDHKVTIYDGETVVTEVHVALARSPSERRTGLMEVYEMPFDTGMLFLFDDERPRSFWMANTPLSLDILFLDSNRKFVRIRTNTIPFSRRSITSDVPAQYVLEVNSGFASAHDIREGMHIDWE